MTRIRADYTVKVSADKKTVEEVGKTEVTMPAIRFNGKGIKWFDDSKLLKKGLRDE